MADPLTVLQEQWESHGAAFCGAEGADNGGREREGTEGADNGGREGSEGADTEGREGTEGADTEGREREGTEGADNGGREGTEGADTEGREREGTEGADTEGREREGIKVPAVGDLDVDRISETLLTGLEGIVIGVKGRILGRNVTAMIKDRTPYSSDTCLAHVGSVPAQDNMAESLELRDLETIRLHATETGSLINQLSSWSLANENVPQVVTLTLRDINTTGNDSYLPINTKTNSGSGRGGFGGRTKAEGPDPIMTTLKQTPAREGKVPIPCEQVTVTPSFLFGSEATELVLDTNTAANNVSVSGDGKTASYSHTDQCYPPKPERFQYYQVLSRQSFHCGRHYWDVVGSKTGDWRVGAAYPSIERGGATFHIGDNRKSWCLCKENNNYLVRHDGKKTTLSHASCRSIRISLDYEGRRLSFYELSEPIRHLHTFTAKFTEPLHAAFWVGRWGKASVTIVSFTI
uniref:B30.2/SPRY domain-containing protein n=1 Tax=Xenopus tropicalis TaxID=8364 RepID=A0A1B8XXI9_XENTR